MSDSFLIYRTEDEAVEVDVRFDNEKETVWLSLDAMSSLFDRDKSTISRHIKNIYDEGELLPDSTVAKYATVQTEGKREVTRNIELTSFKGDRPHLRDTEIAKNYLNEKELRTMGQIVEGYLAFAERQADREEYMTMKDWAMHLDGILTSTGEKLLEGAGSISHEQAIEKAHQEYRKYQERTLSAVERDYLGMMKELEQKTHED